METFISFLPIVIYSLVGTALFYFKKITFNNQIGLIAAAMAAHGVISFQQGTGIFFIGQLIISSIMFLLLVFFFAGKTSGETLLTMSSLFALIPVPHGIIPLFVVFVLLLVFTIIELRRKSESVKWLIMEAASSTGLAHSAPNYSHLPDRAALGASDKRTSVLPYMAAVMTLASLYYLVRPLFLDS